jgi:hypothetical protein
VTGEDREQEIRFLQNEVALYRGEAVRWRHQCRLAEAALEETKGWLSRVLRRLRGEEPFDPVLILALERLTGENPDEGDRVALKRIRDQYAPKEEEP